MRISQSSTPVTFDASGNGTATILGPKPGYVWLITQVSVFATGVKVPSFKYYKGAVNDANFIAGTFVGNSDSDSDPRIYLYPGEFLTGVWGAGTVGAVGTMVIQGEILNGV